MTKPHKPSIEAIFLPDGPGASPDDRTIVEDVLRDGLLEYGGKPIPIVRNQQVHSAEIIQVRTPPASNEPLRKADGLESDATAVALCVYTADCVPVLIASDNQVLAIHAGWRGLAAGIVSRSCERLRNPRSARAWIGPTIGPCCYEVDQEVADCVAEATSPDAIVWPDSDPKPHLDLQRAARHVLSAGGVGSVETHPTCTFCGDGNRWASYRRDGPGGGRNLGLIWRRD